ncbi:MAG: SDR family NAD(P)-dependent oxidoreductase, partial [Chloroflexota bacterium]
SMGEVAAAYVAGALDLDEAARVICLRSRLLRRVSGKGAMAVVELSLEDAVLALQGYESRLSVAVSNGPRSSVLTGEPEALSDVVAGLEARGVFCRFVKVDVAAHSPQMDAMKPELEQALADLRPRAASVPIYSTVTGDVCAGEALDGAYWGRNLRQPVLFHAAVQRLAAMGHDTFIELSPHPILLPAIAKSDAPADEAQGNRQLTLASLRRGEPERVTMLSGLATLYAEGWPVKWEALHPSGGSCVRLPRYPWQRERFWLEDDATGEHDVAIGSLAASRATTASLLGQHLQSSLHSGTQFWEGRFSLRSLPYLADHKVDGVALLPAAAHLEMALSAAAQVFGPGQHTLERVRVLEALVLPEGAAQSVQVAVSPALVGGDAGAPTSSFAVAARPADASPDTRWTQHASGVMRPAAVQGAQREALATIHARCDGPNSGSVHYDSMAARGLQYGPHFRVVQEIWHGEGEAIARLSLPEEQATLPLGSAGRVALLDACLQVLEAVFCAGSGPEAQTTAYLPVALDRLTTFAPLESGVQLWAHAVRAGQSYQMGDTVSGDIYLVTDEGQVVVEAKGLRMQPLRRAREVSGEALFHEIEWHQLPRPSQTDRSEGSGSWLVFADAAGSGERLASLLEGRGERVVCAIAGDAYDVAGSQRCSLNPEEPEHFRRLLEDFPAPADAPWRGVVHLWSLDAPKSADATVESLSEAAPWGCLSALYLVQALAQAGWPRLPRLWLVTAGAQAVGPAAPVAVAQTALWGLGRVVGHEHPELRCTLVDLLSDQPMQSLPALVEELWSADEEQQVALRGDARYVARLARLDSGASAAAPAAERPEGEARASAPLFPRRPLPQGAFRIASVLPGTLEGLAPQLLQRRQPGPGEVEIAVKATGLNFLNVLSALGACPGYPQGLGPLGLECAGTVAALGDGVDDLRVGDEVLAIAFDSLATHALADRNLVALKPANLSVEQAASLPVVFVTAYYALHHLARLERGERVLVHAAAGGVGLAAVQLARLFGWEVLATAGSAEKRAYLAKLGIQQAMDSRSLAFASEVLERTDGRGVDAVLNSLAGEAIARGLECLAPYGRFLELGKRDIYQDSPLALSPFRKNLSYFAIDLDRMCRERPVFVGSLLREVVDLFARGELQPLPVSVFPAAAAADAFHQMAQARHIGKIVINLESAAAASGEASQPGAIDGEGAYLITGGLGGLGLTLAKWLAGAGVRHLALVGRTPRTALPTAVEEALARLEADGVRVQVLQADVASTDDAARILAAVEQIAPLRGIFHAAGALDDGILLQQSRQRFQNVMRAKVDGSWNLHRLTVGKPLDLFVLFSSVASLLGTPGQGNYAAANAFLDGLAHLRRSLVLPALSINWGPWSQVGLASQRERGGRQAVPGLASITPEQGVQALRQLLSQPQTQVGVMPFDFVRWAEAHPADMSAPFFARLAAQSERAGAGAGSQKMAGQAPAIGLREALLALEPGRRRRAHLESYLREQAAQVLRLAVSRVDPRKPLRSLGMDSLMTLEFRNRVEAGSGLSLSATLVWNYPTVDDMVPYLAGAMGIPLEAARAESGGTTPASAGQPDSQVASDVDGLSPEALQSLLVAELDSVDQMLREG